MTDKKSPARKKAPAKKAAVKRKGGRATHPLKVDSKEWDRAKVMALVLERIATSNMGMQSVLEQGYDHGGKHYGLPMRQTVMAWIAEDQELADNYARAREQQAYVMHDDILESHKTAKVPLLDDLGKPVLDKDGKEIMFPTSASVQLAKLESDNKKWLMSKLMPKKYGDKQQIDHTSKGERIGSYTPEDYARAQADLDAKLGDE